jgi:hypothetical protein
VGTIDRGDVAVEGGNVACVAGVEEQGFTFCGGGTVDYEETVP